MSRMPLYQIEYSYISTESPMQQNPGLPEGKIALPGFESTALVFDRKTSPVDLQITFGESDQLNLMFEYNTRHFEVATIHRLANHLISLLGRVPREPERPIATLTLLNPEERRHVEDFNPKVGPEDKTDITELFEAQVARATSWRFGGGPSSQEIAHVH